MIPFAKLNENNIVIEVHCVDNNELIDSNNIEQESKGIDFLINWSSGYTQWKQTSYNGSFRKNYAGIGYFYDEQRNAFIPPKPFESWILNEDSCQWQSPIPMPTDENMYRWNETNQEWEVVNGT